MSPEGRGTVSALIGTVRDEMADRGMSQVELSRQTGIPQPTLSRKLNGHSALTVGELARIAAVLGVPAWELFA